MKFNMKLLIFLHNLLHKYRYSCVYYKNGRYYSQLSTNLDYVYHSFDIFNATVAAVLSRFASHWNRRFVDMFKEKKEQMYSYYSFCRDRWELLQVSGIVWTGKWIIRKKFKFHSKFLKKEWHKFAYYVKVTAFISHIFKSY